jgi:hypothetical protein
MSFADMNAQHLGGILPELSGNKQTDKKPDVRPVIENNELINIVVRIEDREYILQSNQDYRSAASPSFPYKLEYNYA